MTASARADPGPPIRTQKIPKGDIFVMGDNRGLSDDSRDYGPIPESLIVGRAVFGFWPLVPYPLVVTGRPITRRGHRRPGEGVGRRLPWPGDIARAGHLYHPDVVYSSPTTRLFGWPRLIEGRDRTLEFIQLTITGLADIDYRLDERAVIDRRERLHADPLRFRHRRRRRLRSAYVVVYRYRQGLIARAGALLRPERPSRRNPGRERQRRVTVGRSLMIG